MEDKQTILDQGVIRHFQRSVSSRFLVNAILIFESQIWNNDVTARQHTTCM